MKHPAEKSPRSGTLEPGGEEKECVRSAIRTCLAGLAQAGRVPTRSDSDVSWHEPRLDQWTISVLGSAQQIVSIELTLGEYTLQLVSFFMRAPDENVVGVFRHLLRRNLELPAVKFGVDEFGDIYLRADIPIAGVSEADLDRLIGLFYACADSNYLTVMRLGFEHALQSERSSGIDLA